MSVEDSIKEALAQKQAQLVPERILELLLPIKKVAYSLSEIDDRLYQFRDQLEEVQRIHNDRIERIFDRYDSIKAEETHEALQSIQLEILKLQCDIAFTKEQLKTVKTTCDSPFINERQELLAKQEMLSKLIEQQKFSSIKDFYQRYIGYIESTLDIYRKFCSRQSSELNQLFDWREYYNAMILLRACGKIIKDLRNFEILYQNSEKILSIKFEQSTGSLDLNNLIESPQVYTIESQLDITTQSGQHVDLGQILVQFTENSHDEDLNFELFKELFDRIIEITKNGCKFMMDLNMNYIEANLTYGINIDKLNGNDGTSSTSMDLMPLYAFSPQEYITKIGQHLLNLRKQTEQFNSNGAQSLRVALAYIKGLDFDVNSCGSITEIIMRCVTRHCIKSFLGRTSNSVLSQLTPNGMLQLSTEVFYLATVVEDLKSLDANDSEIIKLKGLMIR